MDTRQFAAQAFGECDAIAAQALVLDHAIFWATPWPGASIEDLADTPIAAEQAARARDAGAVRRAQNREFLRRRTTAVD